MDVTQGKDSSYGLASTSGPGLAPTLPGDANYSYDGLGAFSRRFPMYRDWADPIIDYSASGVYTSTTTASSTSAGSINVYLTDASTFKRSQGISIVGAGTAGADHTTTIASVNTASNYVVLDVATVTTVSSGSIVYHDDTVALQSALSDTGSASVYLPAVRDGQGYIISASKLGYDAILAMTLLGKNLVGVGQGQRLYQVKESISTGLIASPIYIRNATADGIHMGSMGTTIKGINFLQHSSVTRTAGSTIRVGVASDGATVYETSAANYTSNHMIRDCQFRDSWDAITLNQDYNARVYDTSIFTSKRYGININRKVPYGGDDFVNVVVGNMGVGTGSATGTGAGIYVEQSDFNKFVNYHSSNNKYGFYHNLSTTSQGQQLFTGGVVDGVSIGGYGVYVSGSTAQAVGNKLGFNRIFCDSGTGAAYLGANSRRNILKDCQLYGTATITDLDTSSGGSSSNIVSDNPVN